MMAVSFVAGLLIRCFSTETQENRSPQILPAHAIGAKRVAMPPIEKALR